MLVKLNLGRAPSLLFHLGSGFSQEYLESRGWSLRGLYQAEQTWSEQDLVADKQSAVVYSVFLQLLMKETPFTFTILYYFICFLSKYWVTVVFDRVFLLLWASWMKGRSPSTRFFFLVKFQDGSLCGTFLMFLCQHLMVLQKVWLFWLLTTIYSLCLGVNFYENQNSHKKLFTLESDAHLIIV